MATTHAECGTTADSPSSSTHSTSATPRKKCYLTHHISSDVTLYMVAFFPLESLLSFSATNQFLSQLSRSNAAWRPLVKSQLDISDPLVDKPPSLLLSEAAPQYTAGEEAFSCYLSWRQEFQGYPLDLVCRVKTWWRRMEAWLSSNFPIILTTLGPPLSENDVVKTLTKDRAVPHFSIPLPLRILYRFHNGQHLPAQTRLLRDRSAEMESLEEVVALGHGLFGGVSFYHTLLNCYLLPLETVVTLNKGSRGHYRDDNRTYSARLAPLHQDREYPSNWNRRSAADFTLFAINTIGLTYEQSMPEKGYFCGRSEDNNEVYTNLKGSLPVDDDLILNPLMSSTQVAAAKQAGEPCLLRWLFEYLRRLETNIYKVEPKEMPYCTLAQQTRIQSDMNRFPHFQISLFRTDGPRCVTNGVELTASPYCVTNNSVITQGNAATVASPPLTQSFFWTYSIRMRLLEDDPSRPPRLHSAQLVSRHWVIQEEDKPASVVNGPGVVGATPILVADRRLPFPFSYQSCSEGRKPQLFGGRIHFRCAAGALRYYPGGPLDVVDTKGTKILGDDCFDAELPTFSLDVKNDEFMY